MAFGPQTVSDFGGAVSDLFSADLNAESDRIKAQGDLAEGQQYTLAAGLARQNEVYTEQSTAVKQMQESRQLQQVFGQQRTAVTGSGFQYGGSALDILRSSAEQGALDKQVIGQQGLITEAGYEEQAQAYTTMANYATQAASAEEDLAKKTQLFGDITAGIKAATGIATFFT